MKIYKSKKSSLTLHTLKAAETTKNRKRLGRGESSGTGKTAGRGQKGQKSRSGGGVRPGFEGGQMPLFRRIPKFHRSRRRLETSLVVVNTKALKCLSTTQVTVATLYQAGLVRSSSAVVKILGDGDVDRAYQVQVQQISAVAQKKILAAGGQVELLK